MSPKKNLHFSKKLALQIAISGVLLLFVFRKLDLTKLVNAIGEVNFTTILALCTVYFLGQVISSAKWYIFVKHAELDRSWKDCLRAYFLGMFFNSFGLGTVGGDVARAVAIKPEKGERAAAFATVIADRLHGLAVLLAIGGIGIALNQPAALGPLTGGVVKLSVLAWSVVGVLALGWFSGPILLLRFASMAKRLGKEKMAKGFVAVSKAFPTAGYPFLIATTLSATFHSTQIAMHMIMVHSLGVDVSWGYLFAVIPLVNAASSLPVSIQGLGVRESSYLLLLPSVGIPPEDCVVFGALWFITASIVSALGALVVVPNLFKVKEDIEETIEVEQAETIQKVEVLGKAA